MNVITWLNQILLRHRTVTYMYILYMCYLQSKWRAIMGNREQVEIILIMENILTPGERVQTNLTRIPAE